MLFQPHQFIQGIEAECPDAGDLLQAPGAISCPMFSITASVRGHFQRSSGRARAVLIDQRAVNAKGGHRDAANPARGQFGRRR